MLKVERLRIRDSFDNEITQVYPQAILIMILSLQIHHLEKGGESKIN
jgi:hypothetical protein